jgi:phosphoglycolate phosphatase-like HAD superfamily hydrolase
VTAAGAVAIDLDGALGSTRELWLDWPSLSRPSTDADARRSRDRRGCAELTAEERELAHARGQEERAPVYLRRDPAVSAALRTLGASGREIGVFTDAPEALARVALDQLGASRRVTILETGAGALDRLLVRLGAKAVVVRTRPELLQLAA